MVASDIIFCSPFSALPSVGLEMVPPIIWEKNRANVGDWRFRPRSREREGQTRLFVMEKFESSPIPGNGRVIP